MAFPAPSEVRNMSARGVEALHAELVTFYGLDAVPAALVNAIAQRVNALQGLPPAPAEHLLEATEDEE